MEGKLGGFGGLHAMGGILGGNGGAWTGGGFRNYGPNSDANREKLRTFKNIHSYSLINLKQKYLFAGYNGYCYKSQWIII